MYSERPTDYVLKGTLREEVSETSLRRDFNAKFNAKSLFIPHIPFFHLIFA